MDGDGCPPRRRPGRRDGAREAHPDPGPQPGTAARRACRPRRLCGPPARPGTGPDRALPPFPVAVPVAPTPDRHGRLSPRSGLRPRSRHRRAAAGASTRAHARAGARAPRAAHAGPAPASTVATVAAVAAVAAVRPFATATAARVAASIAAVCRQPVHLPSQSPGQGRTHVVVAVVEVQAAHGAVAAVRERGPRLVVHRQREAARGARALQLPQLLRVPLVDGSLARFERRAARGSHAGAGVLGGEGRGWSGGRVKSGDAQCTCTVCSAAVDPVTRDGRAQQHVCPTGASGRDVPQRPASRCRGWVSHVSDVSEIARAASRQSGEWSSHAWSHGHGHCVALCLYEWAQLPRS